VNYPFKDQITGYWKNIWENLVYF